ncbi:MAG: UvrD-helicase domain-containing protein [Gammaproteobacteria bacterium]
MSVDTPVSDADARRRALEPGGSFIVQAPAGSGKTELLTQRCLCLLATVEYPEEVLAITFTRKAAGEMRERILSALHAASAPCPDEAHRAVTWRLARAAADRDRARGWNLLATPGRLRVQTIDGLCATLTRQLPVLSALGAAPTVLEAPEPHYEAAARRAVAALETDLAAALEVLLPHLENDVERLVRLIAGLLPRREQWLHHLLGAYPREALEAALRNTVTDQLERAATACPSALAPELLRLARFAAAHVDDPAHPLAGWAAAERLPGAGLAERARWLGLAELLLTRGGPNLRKRVDARQGFPAPSQAADAQDKVLFKQAKADFAALAAALGGHPDFLAELDECRYLPPPHYEDAQWAVLQALGEVLVRAAAELQLVFAEHAEVDFVEVHLRALQALGGEDDPTDLALALDYRLRHILVDEFQDTSSGLYRLLCRLTAGWQPGDGRTLFLVGDPMQSIYGFREAEVGLFLETRARGIGDLHLEPLALEVNFRSQANLVAWVHRAFAAVLPATADPAAGAVPYSPSVPVRAAEAEAGVDVVAAALRDDAAEAERIVGVVRETLARDPRASVAVLGRNRSHLLPGARALKAAGISFQAVELEPLAELSVVQDLRSLTRALLHGADRPAGCNVLRAPWCGLALPDLLATVGEGCDEPVWPRLAEPAVAAALSTDGRRRLARVRRVLADALAWRRRLPLCRWVEGVWIALGGPATLDRAIEREAAAAYFELLGRESHAGDLPDLQAFDRALARLYAPPDPAADGRVQLMTMHKAKGLEFDVVILPGLGRRPRQDELPLLDWQERPGRHGDIGLLLAPIRPTRDAAEPIQAYLRRLGAARSRLEDGRLLYVAATRARRRLYLLGHAAAGAGPGRAQPDAQSLLARLWPAVETAFAALPAAAPAPAPAAPAGWPLRRLPADWAPTALDLRPLGTPTAPTVQDVEEQIPFDWAGQTARHVGTLVHRWLERFARDGAARWSPAQVDALQPRLEAALRILGVGDEHLPEAAARCTRALRNVLNDPRGRWILGDHPEHRAEYALTAWQDGRVRHYVIDRTFVDADGTRWVIDYKTGQHLGGDVEAFLDREQERYRAQLETYATLWRELERRPVRLGLYFPLLPAWRDWSP